MSAPVMDPQYEQRLRDEVIYLHSLWHQGPPRTPTAFTSTSTTTTITPHHLQPSNTTQFKKESRGKKTNKFKKKTKRKAPDSKSLAEWPCPTPSPQETSGWPSLVAQPVQLPLLPSPEEKLKFAAKQAQHNALKTVREFLSSKNSDSESDSIGSSSNDDDEFMEEDDGRHDYTFFLKVFMEDMELKEYYEKNFVEGEFSCLICAAVGGKNTGKRFKGCMALVQHSITIAKTKKRRAHRAYGQAICKVLGWDIDRLPTIVSMLSDNSGEAQRNLDSGNKDNSVNLVNNVESGDGSGVVVPENSTIGSGSVPNSVEGIMNPLTAIDANNNLEGLGMVNSVNVEETVAEGFANNSLVVADADYTLEGLDMVSPSNVEETVAAGLTSNSLMAADADNTLGNLGMVHPLNVEETVAEGLPSNSLMTTGGNDTLEDVVLVHSCNVDEVAAGELASGFLDENNGVEMGIAVLDGLKEDAKTED